MADARAAQVTLSRTRAVSGGLSMRKARLIAGPSSYLLLLLALRVGLITLLACALRMLLSTLRMLHALGVIALAVLISSCAQRGPMMMNNSTHEFERLLGRAALALWSDFPRDVQERLFETTVAGDEIIRNHLALYLHDHHPKTAHPAKPTQLA
jgi:hypothetical protein